ncbi:MULTISPECIES: hypothetical protein [Actinomadura]|uniref:Uncharacterized protein n=1 Tax=Actinomadura yumaensis TaxID=111807 RepID=A0ABW2CJD3_9ACTN|nr:hypothetical protein [Actinomadura sp. J1-007]
MLAAPIGYLARPCIVCRSRAEGLGTRPPPGLGTHPLADFQGAGDGGALRLVIWRGRRW